MIEIEIRGDDATRVLWRRVGEIARALPPEWVLIGGLMVQLHGLEHGVTDVRPTMDIDVLGQARPPGPLPAIDAALVARNFDLVGPDPDGYAQRYEHDGLVVDVLAPDGIKPPPVLGRGLKAVGVPGGSQALRRAEVVSVSVEGETFVIRRPSLLGAVLIKARSLAVHRDPDSQRLDLLLLLSVISEPRVMAGELSKAERRWLRAVEGELRFGEPIGLGVDRTRRADFAYRLLLG